MQKIRKTNESIPRKLRNERTDGRTDRDEFIGLCGWSNNIYYIYYIQIFLCILVQSTHGLTKWNQWFP